MDKKVSIVFHSVCGNNFLIAKEFYKEFNKYNIEVQLLRVNDPNLEELAKQFEVAAEHKEDILKIEEARVEKLFDSHIIIFGSPTYFGNVSGAMKTFMDSFSPHWPEGKFWGKKMLSYTTCANGEGGGDLCLNTMTIFGQHMGMVVVPVPGDLVAGESFPAYGLIHYVGDYSSLRPTGKTIHGIKGMTKRLMKI